MDCSVAKFLSSLRDSLGNLLNASRLHGYQPAIILFKRQMRCVFERISRAVARKPANVDVKKREPSPAIYSGESRFDARQELNGKSSFKHFVKSLEPDLPEGWTLRA
jgi:hypothetical protein